MRTIWRVEDPDGRGPYVGRPRDNTHENIYSRATGHPGPLEDDGLDYRDVENAGEWHFGFSSLEQYRAWFSRVETRKALREAGYRLVRYAVPLACMRSSAYQAIFVRSEAQRVSDIGPDFDDE